MDKKELLTSLGTLELTKSDLSKLTGVSKASVTRWASGNQPIPKWLESWFALALKLKTIGNIASEK